VEYAKRQYYVKIEGVVEWEGWADAGSLIRLNATVVGGVEYTPAEVCNCNQSRRLQTALLRRVQNGGERRVGGA
jgi:hypothetical protein